MAIKLKIPTGRPAGRTGWFSHDPLLQAALVIFLVLGTATGAFFTYYYVKFGRMIDQRFKGPVFGNSARLYATARVVRVVRPPTVQAGPDTTLCADQQQP